MKIKDMICEELDYNSRDLIIVDIQPAYCEDNFDIVGFNVWLNENSNKFNRIFFLYNGEGFTSDDFYTISEWYEMNGLESIRVTGDSFDKGYAFFRDAMDEYDDDVILSVGKYLYDNGLTDSRDIDVDAFTADVEESILNDMVNGNTSIYIPEVIDILANATNPVVVGGGRDECLYEVELLLKILNIEYDLEYEWVY